MASFVVHFEIHASEPQRLVDFYTALLGWRFAPFRDAAYWTIDTGEGAITSHDEPGEGINGGLVPRQGPAPGPGAPVNGSTVVVMVDDVDATVRRALELGGDEAVAPYDMDGVGRLAYLRDPDGNVLGVVRPTAEHLAEA
jgi:predicted enzyme related to lactoylglutathione lyase